MYPTDHAPTQAQVQELDAAEGAYDAIASLIIRPSPSGVVFRPTTDAQAADFEAARMRLLDAHRALGNI